jgi:hypothetical protein
MEELIWLLTKIGTELSTAMQVAETWRRCKLPSRPT